jgi:hypothetical protein
MTATEVAAAYRLPLGTVYRLASTEDWERSLDGRRPVLYAVDDVEATMARRLDGVTCGEASSDQPGCTVASG